jgi:hypothetical protein
MLFKLDNILLLALLLLLLLLLSSSFLIILIFSIGIVVDLLISHIVKSPSDVIVAKIEGYSVHH